MSQRRDKTTGLPLPSPVNPGTTVCFQMTIPNAPEYRQALRGVIADLGKYWTWSQTVGQSSEPALEAAELWRQAALTITYSSECPEPMSCDDIADCIENDPAARAAVQEVIGKQATPGTTTTPGERLPDAKWAANLTPTDDCDPDVFWAQCEQFVEYIVTAGADFLEIIETYSNAVEAAQFIELAPVLGTIVDEAQIDKAIEFVDWCVEIIKEAYDAANTQPNKTAIACALFCDAKADCELTLEGAFDVINQRIGGIFTPSDLNTTESLIDAALTVLSNPAFPLDTFLCVVLGLGRTMGYLGVQGLNETLNIVLKVAVNDANDDWILLCEDCPPIPEDCLNFTEGQQEAVGYPTEGQANWHNGLGWSQDAGGGVSLIFDQTAIPDEITKIRIVFYRDWAGATPNPDYDKTLGQVGSASGTAPAASWGFGADPLRTGDEVTVEAAPGTYWDKSDMIISVWGGGFTWPQNAPQSTGPQYISYICFNEGA